VRRRAGGSTRLLTVANAGSPVSWRHNQPTERRSAQRHGAALALASLLVAGRDRHRIYWLEGAAESEPLLADHCPSCDRPLPAEHEAGVAVA
jgi:hypothetical protein